MNEDPNAPALAPQTTAPVVSTNQPSGLATALAASMPLFVGLVSTVIFVVGLGHERPLTFVQETGWVSYAIIATTWLSALVLTVTLGLAGRGARLPVAVSLFFAGLPWVAGVAGVRLSMSMVIDALRNADPISLAPIMAQGFSEASGSRLLGAWCTASLAGALALGFAISSLGQRSPNRKPLFGVVGFALGLPVLAVVGYAVTSHTFGISVLYLGVVGLGVLAALSLGAAGAGDSQHGRGASLSAAVAPAALVSFLGAVTALQTSGVRSALSAVANIESAERGVFFGMAAEAFTVGERCAWLGAAALGLAAIVLGAWAASRARPTVGAIVGGIAVVCVAALVIGADRAGELGTEYDLGEIRLTAWQDVDGFIPTTIAGDDQDDQGVALAALVTIDSITPHGESAVALATLNGPAGRAALASTLRRALAGESPDPTAMRRSKRPPGIEPDDGGSIFAPQRSLAPDRIAEPDVSPAIGLTIDARVPAAVLRALFEAAREAGARSVILNGSADELRPEALERLREEAPLMALMAQRTGSVRVLLESALPPDYAAADPTLWHTTVTSDPRAELRTRAGTIAAPRTLSAEGGRYGRRLRDDDSEQPRAVVYLALSDSATNTSLATLSLAATRGALWPLVVTGPLPGHPETPATEPLHGDGGPDPLGLADLARTNGPTAAIPADETNEQGSLSRSAIQRVIRGHMSEVRACYERGLMERPTLAGRVNVAFVISGSGSVQSAELESSDLAAPSVERCITSAVRSWTFPAPQGGVAMSITYPFVLHAD